MGKNFWVNDKDLKTVWVICDKCLEINRKANRRNKEHWVQVGKFSELEENAKKGNIYPIYRIRCCKGHEIDMDLTRPAFFRKGLKPKD